MKAVNSSADFGFHSLDLRPMYASVLEEVDWKFVIEVQDE